MGEDVMERAERVLWIWTGGELVGLVVFWFLWGSLFGGTGELTWVSREARLAGLAFVLSQLLVPLAVYLDLRRRVDDPDYMWVHVAAMPALNAFGSLGYVEGRIRTREE